MASHLVGQHQQTSFATPINGAAGDATVVLGNDNATVTTYNAHDIDPTIHVQDSSAAVFGATPAGTAGRKWMTNDAGGVYLYYDTGSAWVEANYQRTSSTGAVVIVSTSLPQLTVEYDGSHTATFSVSSAGLLTINATTTIAITPAVALASTLTVPTNTKIGFNVGLTTYIYEPSPSEMSFVAGGSQFMRFQAPGVLVVGASMVTTNSSAGNLLVQNSSAPSGNPTGGVFLWAESGAFKGRGTSGTVTTIAAADPHCPECGRDFVIEFSNEKYGDLAVCVWCLTDDYQDKPYVRRTLAKDCEKHLAAVRGSGWDSPVQ